MVASAGHTDAGSEGPQPEALAALFVTGFDVESKLRAWLPAVEVRFASSVEDAYAQFDSTVGVVCVSQNVLDDRMESFRADALGWVPLCQFVVIESRPLANDRVDDYDVVLQGPVSRGELQTTIRQRLTYATYSTLLQEYYVLNSQAVALSHVRTGDDRSVPDYIADRVAELLPQLRRLQAALPEADIREISNTVERRRDYLNRPVDTAGKPRTSKYHPGACPECDAVWGIDHGNELGRGFEALGAGVWKCRHCETIVHELHDAQNVTKW